MAKSKAGGLDQGAHHGSGRRVTSVQREGQMEIGGVLGRGAAQGKKLVLLTTVATNKEHEHAHREGDAIKLPHSDQDEADGAGLLRPPFPESSPQLNPDNEVIPAQERANYLPFSRSSAKAKQSSAAHPMPPPTPHPPAFEMNAWFRNTYPAHSSSSNPFLSFLPSVISLPMQAPKRRPSPPRRKPHQRSDGQMCSGQQKLDRVENVDGEIFCTTLDGLELKVHVHDEQVTYLVRLRRDILAIVRQDAVVMVSSPYPWPDTATTPNVDTFNAALPWAPSDTRTRSTEDGSSSYDLNISSLCRVLSSSSSLSNNKLESEIEGRVGGDVEMHGVMELGLGRMGWRLSKLTRAIQGASVFGALRPFQLAGTVTGRSGRILDLIDVEGSDVMNLGDDHGLQPETRPVRDFFSSIEKTRTSMGSPMSGAAVDELMKTNMVVDVIYFGDGIEVLEGEEKGVIKNFGEREPWNSGNALLSRSIISQAVLAADCSTLIPDDPPGGVDTGGDRGGGFEFGVDLGLDHVVCKGQL
ncbi:hypothetical protein BKA70DRAFT_1231587 [Coprinopsis sp. MPI-PUGE-AT-0042]|nr:hypothetical protein BKA70DRAFT_1231587 [Coprinopsis sp. MPI-PUGE-AT-0042]